MKKLLSLFYVCLIALFVTPALYAGKGYNMFAMEKQESTEAYQQYVGKTAVFYEPINEDERLFKLGKIQFGVPYMIQSIVLEGEKVTLQFIEANAVKAKPIIVVCRNGYSSKYGYGVKAGIDDIPLYIQEDLEAAKAAYVGTMLRISGQDYKIADIGWMEDPGIYGGPYMTTCFVYENTSTGNTQKEKYTEALSGSYHSGLIRVEKPADESVRYGETSTIDEEGITKYSYVDNIIDIVIFGTSQEFSFVLKNVSENSIKLVWNEAVFVGTDGTTSKVMHQGIKYSQKDGDQPASVVIRGAKLSDVAVPTENVRYSSILKEWVTDSMYPSKRGEDGQVSLMLPIQIKETINEYIFVFDVKYEWKHPELHEQDL